MHCKEHFTANREQLAVLGREKDEQVTLYRGRGCPVCNNTGYLGRAGVYEVMTVTKQHRELINRGCSEEELSDLSVELGMKTLKDNARDRVLQGITTIEEMIRISYSNE